MTAGPLTVEGLAAAEPEAQLLAYVYAAAYQVAYPLVGSKLARLEAGSAAHDFRNMLRDSAAAGRAK